MRITEFRARLKSIIINNSPFGDYDLSNRELRWIRTQYVLVNAAINCE